ncbi:MAG: ABC transporter substrate-binding protein, partial [Deltaproteobacteria bacterium]|nr:ABC transporter substrate-binding protein [Deltaproteobacteria bacterium]
MSRFTKLLVAMLVASGLILATGGWTDVKAAPKYRWKLAQTWGTGFPIFGDAV